MCNFSLAMIIRKEFILNGQYDRPMLTDIRWKDDGTVKPLLVFVHGFKGFKDWGHFNLIADALAQNGFAVLRFNFSFNGTTPEHPVDFVDLDAFGNNNYFIEFTELGKVIDYCLSDAGKDFPIHRSGVFLLGHSRGGGIALLRTAQDKRVKASVTWASVSDFLHRDSKRSVEAWKKNETVYTLNGRTQQNMPLYPQFYRAIIEHSSQLDILSLIKNLSTPLLIVHGTADQSVLFQEAERLKKTCSKSLLIPVDGANHTFGGVHPFEGEKLPSDTVFTLEHSVRFLKAQLIN